MGDDVVQFARDPRPLLGQDLPHPVLVLPFGDFELHLCRECSALARANQSAKTPGADEDRAVPHLVGEIHVAKERVEEDGSENQHATCARRNQWRI